MSVTVYGASDDLIEIEGDIREEFSYSEVSERGDGDLLAFSNGVVLRIQYSDAGVWRITPVIGRALMTPTSYVVSIQQAPEDDGDNYSDRATIAGDIQWVVQGIAMASLRAQVNA